MDIRQPCSTPFNIRPDGVIEISMSGAELMINQVLFSPRSWLDIVRVVKSFWPSEFANLDEYGLVYTICTTINNSESVIEQAPSFAQMLRVRGHSLSNLLWLTGYGSPQITNITYQLR